MDLRYRIGNRRALIVILGALIATLFLTSCEDTLTPDLAEAVRIAGLPKWTLTIRAPADGTATPVGQVVVPEGEPLQISVTANSGYTFSYWKQVDGDGEVSFADEDANTTTVTVTGGDAEIEAVIGNTPHDLTVLASGPGTVDPSGLVGVQDGIARNIDATPDGVAYEFLGWSQTGGGGTATFGSTSEASTTVTVTGGDAEITASFAIRTYQITINSTSGGSTNYTNLEVDHGVASSTITATPSAGNSFYQWTVTSGAGNISISPNETSASITVTATGDATIEADFRANRTLTLTNDGNGFTTPPSVSYTHLTLPTN